jgi:tetratricopeptide (TPR) repeat protein
MSKNRMGGAFFRWALMLLVIAAMLPLTATAADTSRFTTQYAEARKQYDAKNYDEAIRIYGEIIRADPQQDGAYNMRSLSYSGKGMREQSMQDVRRAVELAPANGTYRFNLAFDYYYARQYDQVLTELEQAEKNGFKQSMLFAYRGAAKLRKGQIPEAIAAATEALRLDSNNTFANGIRGEALYRSEKYKEAIDDYTAYLRARTTDNIAFAEQGYAYYKLGMMEEARRNAVRMMELEPRLRVNFEGDKALGIYDREMRRAKVREQLEAAQAAETAGDWPAAFTAYSSARLWSMGYTASDLADSEKANEGTVSAYLKLAQKPPLPEEARRYVVQARTFIGDKRFEDANGALNHAASLAPWYPTLYYDRALVSAELKRWDAAIASMKYYMKLAPDAPDTRQVQDKIYEWEARMK